MKTTIVYVVVALALALINGCTYDAMPELPLQVGYVSDYTEVFSQETKDSVVVWLRHYEDTTNNEVAILTVEGIGENTIQAYAELVAGEWKLGIPGKGNGVLVLVVKMPSPSAYIAVGYGSEGGYGLEGVLTSEQCTYIIKHCFDTHFSDKTKDYDAALEETVGAIITTAAGNFATVEHDVFVKNIIFGIVFVVVIVGMIFLGVVLQDY